jgi:hypothetical protein
MADENKSQQQMQILIDDEMMKGVYANIAMVSHNETEFTMDYAYAQPQKPAALVRARVIVSPKHMKQLIDVLSTQVAQYETKFGPIQASKTPIGLLQ